MPARASSTSAARSSDGGECASGRWRVVDARLLDLALDGGLAAYAADKHGSTALMWAAGGGHLQQMTDDKRLRARKRE